MSRSEPPETDRRLRPDEPLTRAPASAAQLRGGVTWPLGAHAQCSFEPAYLLTAAPPASQADYPSIRSRASPSTRSLTAAIRWKPPFGACRRRRAAGARGGTGSSFAPARRATGVPERRIRRDRRAAGRDFQDGRVFTIPRFRVRRSTASSRPGQLGSVPSCRGGRNSSAMFRLTSDTGVVTSPADRGRTRGAGASFDSLAPFDMALGRSRPLPAVTLGLLSVRQGGRLTLVCRLLY